MALPAYLALRVLQASKNGLTKLGRRFRSLPRSALYIKNHSGITHQLPAGLLRLLEALSDRLETVLQPVDDA